MMELQRATTPTSRQSMHTTLYIPGRGILSTADVLLVKHPVGRAPRSLQTLLPEQMAYGVKNVSGEGGTREAMTWATAQEQTTPEKEKKMSFDIVGMNREASRAGHTKPDSKITVIIPGNVRNCTDHALLLRRSLQASQ